MPLHGCVCADLRFLAVQSPATRSPRAKRARVSSPLASKGASTSSATTTQALSGASGPGVTILQTLATADSGAITETTEVKVDVPVTGATADDDAAPQFDADADAQIAAAQKLVDSLKKEHVLADLAEASHIPDPHPSSAAPSTSSSSQKKQTKRALEADEDELPASGTLADALTTVDNRSFFSKLFRRNARRKVPTQAGRETRALPAPRAARQQSIPEVVVREEDGDVQGETRRWAAGFGLAVAVGATAAAPYLFG